MQTRGQDGLHNVQQTRHRFSSPEQVVTRQPLYHIMWLLVSVVTKARLLASHFSKNKPELDPSEQRKSKLVLT